MIHYNYSPNQLEQKAEELLRNFDEERLVKIKPLDVYAVIEKCLDVQYDWKYLTPDQSILGMTVFSDGCVLVWPEPYFEEGMKPTKAFFKAGTIVIDSTLTEREDRGPENFTVMHEAFHQVLHKRCFRHGNPDYAHVSTKDAITSRKKPMTSLQICEYQANACAAAFLMPRDLVANMVRQRIGNSQKLVLSDQRALGVIKGLAADFNVSLTAMKYRLLNLKLAVN